jgi:perosamine synthetase
MIGYNDRMTDMQAAIGIAQLRRLEAMNSKREKNARFLTRMLRPLGWIETPFVSRDVKHAWHQYTIKVPAGMRDDFMGYLNSKGIGARVYYPRPVHMQPVYHSMGYREGLCPVAEAVSKQVLSLPVHPQLKKTELEEIVETIEKYRAV